MSGRDFVRRLGEQARVAADGESLERTVSAGADDGCSLPALASGSGRAQEDDAMALRDLNGGLIGLAVRTSTSASPIPSPFRQQSKDRERAWTAAGNEGHPPHGPIYELAPTATRAEREMWRKLAQGEARVLHMGHDEGTSPFNSLEEAYAMSDEDLLAVINSHPSAAVWP